MAKVSVEVLEQIGELDVIFFLKNAMREGRAP